MAEIDGRPEAAPYRPSLQENHLPNEGANAEHEAASRDARSREKRAIMVD